MLEPLMNYQNSLCDVAMPFGPPPTTGELAIGVTMIVGFSAAIIVAGILVKMAVKKNSEIQKQNNNHQDPKL